MFTKLKTQKEVDSDPVKEFMVVFNAMRAELKDPQRLKRLEFRCDQEFAKLSADQRNAVVRTLFPEAIPAMDTFGATVTRVEFKV